jgi:hypothetical protein
MDFPTPFMILVGVYKMRLQRQAREELAHFLFQQILAVNQRAVGGNNEDMTV